MPMLKILKKLVVFLTAMFIAYAMNSYAANDSVNTDFCIYVDPKSPYYNPNKLTMNQLEECKIRAATIIEIQAFHFAMLKQRFPEAAAKITASSSLPSQQELSQSIESITPKSSEPKQQVSKPSLTRAPRTSAPRTPIITDGSAIADIKSKPLYHRDAGNVVDMNFEVIVTEAGRRIEQAGEVVAKKQLEEIKTIEPVTSSSVTEMIINSRNQDTPALGEGVSIVDTILARQNNASSQQYKENQPKQPESFSTGMNSDVADPTSNSSNNMRLMLQNIGAISKSEKVTAEISTDAAPSEVAQEEPINSESLELLQKIKAKGDGTLVNVNLETKSGVLARPNSQNNSQLSNDAKALNENEIEKYNKSAEIEPIPSI